MNKSSYVTLLFAKDMGNHNGTLRQDVQVLKDQVRSLNQAQQQEQELLEKERLQLQQEQLKEQQKKLEL